MTHETPPQPDMPDEIWTEPDAGGEYITRRENGDLPFDNMEGLTRYVRADKPADNGGERKSFDVDEMKCLPSEDAIKSALGAFKTGKAVNCIQTAHLAKAASLYLKNTAPQPPEVSAQADKGDDAGVEFDITKADIGRYVRRISTDEIERVRVDPGNGWIHPGVVYEWRGYINDLEYVEVSKTNPRQSVSEGAEFIPAKLELLMKDLNSFPIHIMSDKKTHWQDGGEFDDRIFDAARLYFIEKSNFFGASPTPAVTDKAEVEKLEEAVEIASKWEIDFHDPDASSAVKILEAARAHLETIRGGLLKAPGVCVPGDVLAKICAQLEIALHTKSDQIGYRKPEFKITKMMDGYTYYDLLKLDGKKYESFYYWKTEAQAAEAAKQEHESQWGKMCALEDWTPVKARESFVYKALEALRPFLPAEKGE